MIAHQKWTLFKLLVCASVAFAGFQIKNSARAANEELLPPPPVKVLQNRFFNKALRPEFSVFAGTLLSESYTETTSFGLRAGFFFTEWVGLDYAYTTFQVSDSPDLEALRNIEVYNNKPKQERVLIEPSYVSLKTLHSLLATLAPIYGKINVFDLMILYSDIYFSAGTGLLETNQGSKKPLILGVGQRFYFAKRFNLRIDAQDHIFQQVRENLGEQKKSIKHAWTISCGLSVFLW
jgi:outer membrane beta-barrel protein